MKRGNVPVDKHPELTLEETEERFRGDWVLMKVSAYDEFHEPSRGIILAHYKSRKRISAALALEPRPSQLPPGAARPEYYIFKAMRRIRTGEEWRAVIENAPDVPLSVILSSW
ncbi:MAG TPA: hypothetical protein VK821_06625 [Dehalococcoidia bacterium]|nr:hypothetical protein [Dehalococcoidia bacterium]